MSGRGGVLAERRVLISKGRRQRACEMPRIANKDALAQSFKRRRLRVAKPRREANYRRE